MSLAGRARSEQFRHKIKERSNIYSSISCRFGRLKHQLDSWNEQWAKIRVEVPHYAEMRSLPVRFNSWEEFIEIVPVVRRADAKANLARMTNLSRPPSFYRTTGGTTAEPVKLPAWDSEIKFIQPDIWLAREWYGIKPDSPQFLIWGHSHLLGSGLSGWFNARKREWRDWLLGYYRFSAYDLRPAAMRKAALALLKFRPEYVVGYSVALDLFARAAWEFRSDIRNLGVKVVIGAAEGFPSTESVNILRDLFGCPVAMEYGSVETNFIAHTRPGASGYRTFWHTYFVEVSKGGVAKRIRVTSLYPRCFPLVRYELGDEIELDDEDASFGLDSFRRVVGRCNDYVTLGDGTLLHSELFTHAIREISTIRAYQVIQDEQGIQVNVIADGALDDETKLAIQSKLLKVHKSLSRIPIVQTDRLQQTIAGKVPMILRRP